MRSAWMIGGVVGLVAGMVSIGLGLVGFVPFCGCITGPLNWVLPAVTGLAAGGLAASQADWSTVEPGAGVATGATEGAKAGVVAGAIAAVAYVVVSLLSPLFGLLINTIQYGGSDDMLAMMIGTLIGGLVGIVINLVVAVISAVVGLGLGAAAGAVVGSSKAG